MKTKATLFLLSLIICIFSLKAHVTVPEYFFDNNDFRKVNDLPVSIGANQDMSSPEYEDEIDDIRLYNQELSDFQIGDIFNQSTSTATIYVKSNALGNNDGTSWVDAYTSLKVATDNATVDGDEIWVAAGTYKPDASGRSTYFTLQEGVSLYGGFNGTESQLSERDWISNQTILSGDLADNDDNVITYTNTLRNDNSYRVIYVDGSNTLIDGITITGGQANNTANNEFNRGAAIYKNTSASNLTLRNTVISQNVSNREGNVHIAFDGGDNELIIENCIFHHNFARYGSGFSSTLIGGGVLNAKVYNSLFYANVAADITAGDGYAGSSFYLAANDGLIDLTVINSTFTDNEDLGTNATNDKGTIAIRRLTDDETSIAHATVHNNIFHNNLSSSGVVNSQVIGLMNRPTNKMNNLNFTHNISNQTDFSTMASQATVSDNITQDPMFTDAISQDYTLATGSPAIDAGSRDLLPDDLLGDLLGNIRVNNSEVDMGAYEHGSTPINITLGLGDPLSDKIKIYPNPVVEYINIDTEELVDLRFFGLNGQLIKEITQVNGKVDVSNLQTGTYLMEISSEEERTTMRIQKGN